RHALRHLPPRRRRRAPARRRSATRHHRRRQSALLGAQSGRRERHPMIHRSIGSWSHGIIDYAMVIFLIIGPRLIGFNGKQATFCYILAAVHLALTVLTRFPLGVLKVVGFPLHGVVEFLAAFVI